MMALGLVGRKVGMTRVFGEKGEAIPVTVLEVSTNYVAQKKSEHQVFLSVHGRVQPSPN